MELRVGEIAEAVRQMGEGGIPTPVVEAIEEAAEAIEEVAEITLEGRSAGRARAGAIREYILGLDQDTEETVTTVAAALQDRFPGITERDVQNAIRGLPPGSPRLRSLPKGRQPTPPPPPQRGRTPSPRTVAIRNHALSLGQGLADLSSADIILAIRPQFPDVTGVEVLSALSATWRTANNLPNLRRAGTTIEEPPPPPIPWTKMEGGNLEDLLDTLERPQRVTETAWF